MEGFLNPEKVLKQLKLKKDVIAVDFGSGSGGWVLPLAKSLKEGEVYAIDILEEPLSALKSKARIEEISNIETILSDIEKGSKLKESSCDLVLMTNLLFEIKDKEKVFSEAKRVLRAKGKILVVDWKKDSVLGPKQDRVSSEEVKGLAKKLGLKAKEEFEAGLYHWGLILVK
ncbi:class I SAM-dependent methyltransferase [Patescibacteria group bacterium]